MATERASYGPGDRKHDFCFQDGESGELQTGQPYNGVSPSTSHFQMCKDSGVVITDSGRRNCV